MSIVKNPVLSYTLKRRKDAAQYKHTLCIGKTRPTSSEIWAWKSVIDSGEQGTFKSVFELLNLAPFERMGRYFLWLLYHIDTVTARAFKNWYGFLTPHPPRSYCQTDRKENIPNLCRNNIYPSMFLVCYHFV